eukprot:CAMPEP_0197840720 /NCGR_PEP_ID=MMETSP1437-20131217/45765_1 /TAXON_ID=49252 ORGANISM="Eucampia antarctica, Strain CCMP1452" /NCGR_SAMPLE_ID=MMETSP1437 /ASSEMBLY_ACC=CAM_ASM_001096 /LENGTH=64 /DNA_ID=CAMNT_0043450369 /DNA_START=755 /DNA_END=949 /DNA_ORIENTATION=-
MVNMVKDEEPLTPIQIAINVCKIIFAVSPLLVLGYVLLQAFEDDNSEDVKRKQKTDFRLAGHEE